MPNYKNITNAAQPAKDGGYKSNIYFSELASITTFEYPTAAGSVIGDKYEIPEAHTWATGSGAYNWETKIGSVKHTTETQGDEGAKVPIHVVTVSIQGDDAATLEMMVQQLNDRKVAWIKDADCLVADSYVQFGDECNPVTAEFSFDGKDSLSTSTAQKEYILTLRCKKKYFYAAALDTTF